MEKVGETNLWINDVLSLQFMTQMKFNFYLQFDLFDYRHDSYWNGITSYQFLLV